MPIDHVLKLYSESFRSPYLHYGFWDEPDKVNIDTLTLNDMVAAQQRYIEHLASFIPEDVNNILDVGAGIGGNSSFLLSKGFSVEALSPDDFQEKVFAEKYNGIFRKVGECPTPWPCFVVAVRNEVLENNFEDVKKVLDIINFETKYFKKRFAIDQTLANRYEQQLEDIQQWLKITEWNDGKPITKNLITRIQNKMVQFNVIKEKQISGNFIKNMYN